VELKSLAPKRYTIRKCERPRRPRKGRTLYGATLPREAHKLTAILLEEINAHLRERGLMMREGTMVDATLISAQIGLGARKGNVIPQTRWQSFCRHIELEAGCLWVHLVVYP
jgi:hypothetical protein